MNKKIFLVLPLILAALILGMLGGLVRMGWAMNMPLATAEHGALMIGSFLGTLICLERVVVLKHKLWYVVPIISALSLPLFYLGFKSLAYWSLIVGSAGLIVIFIELIRRFSSFYFYIMMVGAAGWLIGNILLATGNFYPLAAPWWIVFILFTVVGERLELSKFLPPKKAKSPLLILSLAIILAGFLLDFHDAGQWLAGFGFVCIAAWLIKYDIARRSLNKPGVHGYTGTLLFTGYLWLVVTGMWMMISPTGPLSYDAILHSFFIGFTFSMIFAHGPIIFPGVAGLPLKPYHRSLYIWAMLLQVSLAMRLVADAALWPVVRKAAGMANGVVIALYFVNLVLLIVLEHRQWQHSTRSKKKMPKPVEDI
jgi:hypothetical protein